MVFIYLYNNGIILGLILGLRIVIRIERGYSM